MKNKCSKFWKKVFKWIGKPQFLDFVGDDVIWRTMTILFLASFFIFTFGIAIRYLLEGLDLREDKIATNLAFFKFPNETEVFYGQPISAKLRVSKKFKSDGIFDCAVSVQASSFDSVEKESDFTLLELREKIKSDPQLFGGLTQYSDQDGIVKFSDISIISGSSNTVKLTFSSNCNWKNELDLSGPNRKINLGYDSKATEIEFPVTMKSKIQNFYLLNNDSINKGTFDYGEEILLVMNITNKEEFLNSELEGVRFSFVPGNRSLVYAEYEAYAVYELVDYSLDENGLANNTIKFLGSTSTQMRFTSFAQGVQLSYEDPLGNDVEGYFELNFTTKVKSVGISQNGSLSVKEGEKFSTPWIISVKDENDFPIPNKPVFVKLSKDCNTEVSEDQEPFIDEKSLYNSLVFTDESGNAVFTDLKFSIYGFTTSSCRFQIKFISDGVSVVTDDIQVNSSISKIVWTNKMTNLTILYTSQMNADFWPVIQVQDELGKGIANKLVYLVISNFTLSPSYFQTDQNGFALIHTDIAQMGLVEGLSEQTYYVSGEILNLDIVIQDFYGDIIEDDFYVSAFIAIQDVALDYLIIPEEGYWQISNGSGTISTRIFGKEMQSVIFLVASRYEIPDVNHSECWNYFRFVLANDVEEVEISYSPDVDNYFIPHQSFGNESIRVKVSGNNLTGTDVTVHVAALNAWDPYFDIFGLNSSYRARNLTNVLFESNYTLDGNNELILDDFVINDQTNYGIDFQHEPFDLLVFVNGIPATSEIFINLKFSNQSLHLNVTWDTSESFTSGYNRVTHQPTMRITDDLGDPVEGYYGYFWIANGFLSWPFDYVHTYDAQDPVVRSVAPSDENGTVTWNLSFQYVRNTQETYAYVYVWQEGYYGTQVVYFNVTEEFPLLQYFNFPEKVFINQDFPTSPTILVYDYYTSQPIVNKYVNLLSWNDSTYSFDYKGYEITNQNGIVQFSLNSTGYEDQGFMFIKFEVDYQNSLNFSIKVITFPTHILIASQPINGSQIGYPFLFPTETLDVDGSLVMGSVVVQLFAYSNLVEGKILSAEIEENAGNGVLDPETTSAITDQNGVALFNLKMISGNSGYYTIKFSYNNITMATDPFYLQNPIDSVTSQVYDFRDNIQIGDKFSATVTVNFNEGYQEGINFPITIITKCCNVSIPESSISISSEGFAYFQNIQFDSISGTSDCLIQTNKENKVKGEVSFSILGIQSDYHTFLITSPDSVVLTKAVDSLKQSVLFWVVCLSLAVPFFLNSLKKHNIVTFVVALALMIILMCFLPQLIPKAKKVESRQYISLSFFEGILVFFCSFAFIHSFIITNYPKISHLD
ncbi:hypothetical protein M0811_10959 [Anaeramoeba ignava]|uniref:Uncharacterized protein n=1 Tax=Anaeramoeba ignava TaxID=1746090 RepID=A0A9Q0LCR9_ANAIG|nr:hypothetical protein M0811_10959 [Anaeramoeba ignava]